MRFLFIIGLLPFLASAQTRISGVVIDDRGMAIPLANVLLADTYDGASTDNNGKFDFTTSETGSKMLIVRFVGYHDNATTVMLDGKPVQLTITLKEMINELEAVTISAGSFSASDDSRRTIFKALDIATTAGATADIAGALNTLPGTQKVGESGRLFVRGGDDQETRTFIDGMVVLDAYGPAAPNTPSRGRFLPFMFKGTSFSTGGYSAEFGQALSSTLALDSKDNVETTRTDIGLLSVGADVTHAQAWKTGSAAAKVQYTNITPYFGLINQEIDWKRPPVSTEGIVSLRQKSGTHGMWKAYGNFNHSNFSLYRHSIDEPSVKSLYDLTNTYRYGNVSYKDVLNENWSIRTGLSYTLMKNNIDSDDFSILDREAGVHVKAVAEGSLSDHLELKAGTEWIGRRHEYDIREQAEWNVHEDITAAFAETDVYLSNNFVTRAGVRTEYNAMMDQWIADPRLSVALKTGSQGQVSAAWGTFRQTPRNQWMRVQKSLQSERTEHFILNYQVVDDRRTFRAEVYYKKYNNLIRFENDAALANNSGSGYARGVELFWRDNRSVKNVDYWLSYSFLDTERRYLDFPQFAAPAFASAHNFSVVYKYFIFKLKSQAGLTYSFASGRPYFNPNDDGFHAQRTPNYADLSFNWSYLPKPNVIVHFSCTNVLGRDNVFGYEYGNQLNDDGVYNGRAIRQAAKRFLFIGVFITLSKDKSVNQLPVL